MIGNNLYYYIWTLIFVLCMTVTAATYDVHKSTLNYNYKLSLINKKQMR